MGDFHLIELGGEEVEGGHDSPVGAEAVLLHDLFVVDRVPDVDVGRIRNFVARRVQVDDVRRALSGSGVDFT
jgi:hypothetical protein